jgi:hypothetical protein
MDGNTLEKEDSKKLLYFEKLIEAFPSCLIACHFLYFDAPQDKTDLFLTYLSILVSLISTSIPPNLIGMKFIKFLIYSILTSSIIICNCILFAMISTLDRPISALSFFLGPLFFIIILFICSKIIARFFCKKISYNFEFYITFFLPNLIIGYPYEKTFIIFYK